MKIILIGFMGSGKTTVAKALAEKLNLEVIEMDDLIVERSGRKTINEIFEKDGEICFRELEIEICKELKNKDNIIVSTGGGVVMNKINIDFLKENGRVIFLKTPLKTIKKRLKNSKDRPLFQNKKNVKKIFNFRQKLYEEYGDLIIDTNSKTIDEIVINLINLL